MNYCRRHDLAFCETHKSQCFENCDMESRGEFCSVCVGVYLPPTSSKLGAVLSKEGFPKRIVRQAYAGHFDDYKSPLATPIVALVQLCRSLGREDIAARAINGEWDGTLAESSEWFEREGKGLLGDVRP